MVAVFETAKLEVPKKVIATACPWESPLIAVDSTSDTYQARSLSGRAFCVGLLAPERESGQ
jgi:hypothetical protein